MKIDVITVFPEMFRGFFGESILKRAVALGAASIRTVDLRDFATDRRRTVDDKPYSGGPGMLMKPEVWFQAIEACRGDGAMPIRVVMTTPSGRQYTQRIAEDFAKAEHLVILCGHYEGIDERVKTLVTDEISMGDFVLTGGEIPAAAIVDSVVRLLPGVLGGGAEATAQESFGAEGLLEAPQYTRPPEYRGPGELWRGGAFGGAAVHASAGVSRAESAGGPAQRGPCQDGRMAAAAGVRPDEPEPSRSY